MFHIRGTRVAGRLTSAVLGGAVLVAAVFVAAGVASEPGEIQDPLSEPFFGLTTNGELVPDLFPIRASGVSTAPVMEAARRFIQVLTPEQQAQSVFPMNHIEWRRWHNISGFQRNGVSFDDMSEGQRQAAFDLMRAGLSARGFQQTRDVMRLNGHLAWLVENVERYGEFMYHFNMFGEPSATEPWGWQLNGHHLVVNYFVLGDQVVMTPTFIGSEPTVAEEGPYAGAEVLREEQELAVIFMEALTAEQRATAILESAKPGNNALAQAFQDNLVLDYAGLRATELDAVQKAMLLDLVGLYVGNLREGHARVRMEEAREQLDQTWFAWIGGVGHDAVFYYRIQSPVLLIEFDHQLPVGLPGERVPNRRHIHSLVRTPNGNDYGKDLLRQHYEDHQDDAVHGHID